MLFILLLILLFVYFAILAFNISYDIFRDYQKRLHILIWYDGRDKRKFFDLMNLFRAT